MTCDICGHDYTHKCDCHYLRKYDYIRKNGKLYYQKPCMKCNKPIYSRGEGWGIGLMPKDSFFDRCAKCLRKDFT